jgi:hypothetical protein
MKEMRSKMICVKCCSFGKLEDIRLPKFLFLSPPQNYVNLIFEKAAPSQLSLFSSILYHAVLVPQD